MQNMLEHSSSDAERIALADGLRGHVCEALSSRHANHVLQKFIVTLPSHALQFILDEITEGGNVCEVARHEYGCRILQRLLEHCRDDQVEELVTAILGDVVSLCQDKYGCFVMEHVVEFCCEEQRHRFAMALVQNASNLGFGRHVLAVLQKTFECIDEEDAMMLSQVLVKVDDLLVSMSRNRNGSCVVKAILQALASSCDELSAARLMILSAEASLRKARYGRSVLAACQDAEIS